MTWFFFLCSPGNGTGVKAAYLSRSACIAEDTAVEDEAAAEESADDDAADAEDDPSVPAAAAAVPAVAFFAGRANANFFFGAELALACSILPRSSSSTWRWSGNCN